MGWGGVGVGSGRPGVGTTRGPLTLSGPSLSLGPAGVSLFLLGLLCLWALLALVAFLGVPGAPWGRVWLCRLWGGLRPPPPRAKNSERNSYLLAAVAGSWFWPLPGSLFLSRSLSLSLSLCFWRLVLFWLLLASSGVLGVGVGGSSLAWCRWAVLVLCGLPLLLRLPFLLLLLLLLLLAALLLAVLPKCSFDACSSTLDARRPLCPGGPPSGRQARIPGG